MVINNKIEPPYNQLAPDSPTPLISKNYVKSILSDNFVKTIVLDVDTKYDKYIHYINTNPNKDRLNTTNNYDYNYVKPSDKLFRNSTVPNVNLTSTSIGVSSNSLKKCCNCGYGSNKSNNKNTSLNNNNKDNKKNMSNDNKNNSNSIDNNKSIIMNIKLRKELEVLRIMIKNVESQLKVNLQFNITTYN